MAIWDNPVTLENLIPGLGHTLKDLKNEIIQAKNLERRAQNNIITQLQSKVSMLNAAVQAAQLVVNDITGNLDDTGVHKLIVGPQGGGYNALSAEINAAVNKPILQSSGYYTGVLLLSTAPDAVQANAIKLKMLKIFNIQ